MTQLAQSTPTKKRSRTLEDFFPSNKHATPKGAPKPPADPTKPHADSTSKANSALATPKDSTAGIGTQATLPTTPATPLPTLDQLSPEDRELLALEYETLDPSWLRVLQSELTKPYFRSLKRFLQAERAAGQLVFPPAADIYSWSRYTPASSVRVVILGQDPYHNNNQAHGLCFSVRKGISAPPSLVNMYTALKNDYPDFERPNHGYLAGWAQQGVLMLNAALTVRAHNANSHNGKGWEEFTDAVIRYVNEKKSNVVFLLWGSYAQKKGSGIDKKKHLVLKSAHPSPLSAYRGFFTSNHFKKANEYLAQHNQPQIDWSRLTTDD
ncbi:uracil DNA glycosylase [Dimargaris cristalligena]|nr:uracil DNA glycosylase [Dimargaris cristalligena]